MAKTNLMFIIFNNKDIKIDMINPFLSEMGKEDEEGNTALMYLCKNKYANICDIIPLLSPEIGKQNKEGKTALMYFIETYILNGDDLKKYMYILSMLKNEISLTDNNKNTAFMTLFLNTCDSIIDKSVFKLFYKEIGLQNNEGKTALMRAFCGDTEKIVLKDNLLYMENEIGLQDKYGKTALSYMFENIILAGNDTFEVIKKLYESEGDIKDKKGNFPIQYIQYFEENQEKLLYDCMKLGIEEIIKIFRKNI